MGDWVVNVCMFVCVYVRKRERERGRERESLLDMQKTSPVTDCFLSRRKRAPWIASLPPHSLLPRSSPGYLVMVVEGHTSMTAQFNEMH